LNKIGYTTKRKKPWSHKAVGRVLEQHQRKLKKLEAESAQKKAEQAARDAKQALESPEERAQRIKEDSLSVDFPRYDRDTREMTIETEQVSEAEFERLTVAAHKASKEWEAAEDARSRRPKNWRLTKGLTFNEYWHADQNFERLGLAGKDTWAKLVLPLVVEQTLITGKPVLDLLDAIEGQPAVKGQLRRLWFGTLRELAMLRETTLAQAEELQKRK
jgi:hypothetical protein